MKLFITIIVICVAFMAVSFILEWNGRINIGYWMVFSPILVVLAILLLASILWGIFLIITK